MTVTGNRKGKNDKRKDKTNLKANIFVYNTSKTSFLQQWFIMQCHKFLLRASVEKNDTHNI